MREDSKGYSYIYDTSDSHVIEDPTRKKIDRQARACAVAQEKEMADGAEDVPMCPICHEAVSAEKEDKLECGHEFHERCIHTWIMRAQSASNCPMCRSDMKIFYQGASMTPSESPAQLR